MSIIETLSQKTPPPVYSKILKQFPISAVAKQLKITSGYTYMILSGTRTPGQALEQRFIRLAEQVEAEQNY